MCSVLNAVYGSAVRFEHVTYRVRERRSTDVQDNVVRTPDVRPCDRRTFIPTTSTIIFIPYFKGA